MVCLWAVRGGLKRVMAHDLEQGATLIATVNVCVHILLLFLISLIWGLFEPVEEEKLRQAQAADDMET